MSKWGKKPADPGESSAELSLPDEARRVPAGSRITLGFDGPPLTLPLESDEGPSETDAPLTLDTAELRAPPTAEEAPTRDSLPLELELDSLAPEGLPDAWRVDQRRRSTPPPTSVPAGVFARAVAPTMPAPELQVGDARSPRIDDSGTPPLGTAVHSLPGLAIPAPQLPGTGGSGGTLPLGDGGALGLVERSRPSQPDLDLAAEMAERYALGDFTGALRAAELLLGREDAHPEATRYAQSSRDRLVQLYESHLGEMTQIPQVKVPLTEIRWLGLDHRAGFLLSRVDGVGTVEQLIDVSGMPRLEALKTLVELLDAGAVQFQ